MNTPTFKEQFDKITTAYFNDEIAPHDNCACFVGNLLNNNMDWSYGRVFDSLSGSRMADLKNGKIYTDFEFYKAEECLKEEADDLYTMQEIVDLEKNFLTIWLDGGKTELSLYVAMDSTLDLLRKIHESKGEVIESFEFKQRQLA